MKLFILVSIISFNSIGQNLVLNPSFETYEQCRSQKAESSLPPKEFFWWEPNNSSVDIFSRCNGTVPENVIPLEEEPLNPHIKQNPKHGDNFIGCILNYPGLADYREFAESELIIPLKEKRKYLLSFYCCNSEGYSLELKNIHLGFAKAKKEGASFFNKRSVINPFKVTDTIFPDIDVWLHKSIVYKATGKEKFIVLGNFSSRFLNKKRKQDETEYVSENRAYYLFDDVSVIQIPIDYKETRSDSTILFSDRKWINQPNIGDSISIANFTFVEDEITITPRTDKILSQLAKYLSANPFLTFELSFQKNTNYTEKRQERLLTSREEVLTAQLESLGVSSNRVYFKWVSNTPNNSGMFSIKDNIDGEIFK